MKRHRFIGVDLTDRAFVHQVSRVLKLQPGEEIILCDGKGMESLARIEKISSKTLEVTILETKKSTSEPTRHIFLYCAVLKRENFEWVIQKATEVGVTSIIPIVTRRTVKLQTKTDRLQKIAKEAAEQSGRGIVPTVFDPLPFSEAIKHAQQHERSFFFHTDNNSPLPPLKLRGGEPPLSLRAGKEGLKTIGLFIGPEGGWGPDEIDLAKKSQFEIASLGPLTLRGETAAIVATYLLTQAN